MSYSSKSQRLLFEGVFFFIFFIFIVFVFAFVFLLVMSCFNHVVRTSQEPQVSGISLFVPK